MASSQQKSLAREPPSYEEAIVNFGTPVPLLVGLILILGAVGLFFLDKIKPGYERSSDKVYSILLLLSGIFLLAHLNMELLASFQQVMLVGMLTTMIITDISKREASRANGRSGERDGPPQRYDERPRRVYRAELDDWDSPGPRAPRIPSDRYRSDGYDSRYEPRPLEPRPPAPNEDRRPPARLQPGQSGYPEQRADASYSRGRADSRPASSRPDERSDSRPYNGRPDAPYSERRYDGGSASPPPPNRPQRPFDAPVTANGAGHSLGPQPPREPQPPKDSDGRPPERPPLNVRPRPETGKGSYTDFRPASSDGDSEPYSDIPPSQPPANY